MRTMLGVLMVVAGYVVVYYRLLVRHFYEQQHNVKESTFGALFSFPPYGRLDHLGKKYARRYWIAVAMLVVCLGVFAAISDYSVSGRLPGAGG
jgi:hypothetical protein